MYHQRAAGDVVDGTTTQGHAAEMHVELHHAFHVGHHVVHVTGVMVAGIGAAMHGSEGIEMRARAAGIHRTAIAFFMYMESMRAVRWQATDGAGEMHAT